ncbi:MAG: carbohydrate ABC transporter permease [Treponema sp.]|nr:carbohydrate ABC transporter permease [Treponema sp.]
MSFIRRLKKWSTEDWILNIIITITLLFLVIVTVYPFWNTVAISFNDGLDSIKGGITVWPRKWTGQNYASLFVDSRLLKAFGISVSRTIIQTILSVFCTTMLAYSLSRKEFVLKKWLTSILVISMYVNAGLIPNYMLIKKLHLINNYLVYIVPYIVDVFNFIIVRTYINGLPDSFVESARIDGANEFTIYMRIIMPLIVPVIAMICLFVAVGAWNNWFDTYLYASPKVNLHSLQYKLMEFLNSSQNQSTNAADANAMAVAAAGGSSSSMVTPISIRASITIIATVPILVVYPFLQKYFVVGMTIGGVKE